MAVTNFIWNPLSENVLLETDENNAAMVTYTHEPGLLGELLSQDREGATRDYHYDGRRSTRQLTDAQQDVTDTATYSAFGETVAETGTTTNPFGYNGAVGYYTNSETSDLYVRTRTYNPTSGRWLSSDPLEFVDGPNMYSYVRNRPTAFVDPLGLATLLQEKKKKKENKFRKCYMDCVQNPRHKGKKWGQVAVECEIECEDCPGIEDVIPNGCDCNCPGGKWDFGPGYSSAGGLVVAVMWFKGIATCRSKPKLKVKVHGSFTGGGLIAGAAARFGVNGWVTGAHNCKALEKPISARAYALNGRVVGGTAFFVGTQTNVYYELYGIGIQAKFLKELFKIPVAAGLAYGSVDILDKTCVNRRWK